MPGQTFKTLVRATTVAAVCMAAAPAHAGKTPVAVSDFTGPYAGRVRAGVAKAIEGRVKVVGYTRATAIVNGDVATTRKKRYTLRLAVHGVDGDAATERRYKLKKPVVDRRLALVIAKDISQLARAVPQPSK